ncbi:MAG: hypothetical protein ABL901_15875 [Hyphomicrobiaceae bacterium]|nr:hypothetical protein [Hyphomicrobiaceae bacterium]
MRAEGEAIVRLWSFDVNAPFISTPQYPFFSYVDVPFGSSRDAWFNLRNYAEKCSNSPASVELMAPMLKSAIDYIILSAGENGFRHVQDTVGPLKRLHSALLDREKGIVAPELEPWIRSLGSDPQSREVVFVKARALTASNLLVRMGVTRERAARSVVMRMDQEFRFHKIKVTPETFKTWRRSVLQATAKKNLRENVNGRFAIAVIEAQEIAARFLTAGCDQDAIVDLFCLRSFEFHRVVEQELSATRETWASASSSADI